MTRRDRYVIRVYKSGILDFQYGDEWLHPLLYTGKAGLLRLTEKVGAKGDVFHLAVI